MGANRREFFIGAAAVAVTASLAPLARALAEAPKPEPGDFPFVREKAGGGLTSLRFARDIFSTNYVANGQALGHVEIVWRHRDSAWQQLRSEDLKPGGSRLLSTYRAKDEVGEALAVVIRLEPQGNILRWTLAIRNTGASPLEVGDLALSLPIHSSFDAKEPPTASVLKHSFISGHGSYLFWMRSNGVGPYLLMTPEPDTHLEHWDHSPLHPKPAQGSAQTPQHRTAFRAYVHSAAVAEAIQATGGRWRQPHTRLTLAPGEEEYGTTWPGQTHHRGPWYYSPESDLGYCGALRTAATVVADDPVFGKFCFGGEMRETSSSLEIIPRDGVRRRFQLRTADQHVDLEITGARFAKEKAVVWSVTAPQLTFQVETEAAASGVMDLRLTGMPADRYYIRCNGKTVDFHAQQKTPVRLKVTPDQQLSPSTSQEAATKQSGHSSYDRQRQRIGLPVTALRSVQHR